jgi:hypothetical protein
MFTSNFEKLVSKNLTGEVELVSYRRAFGIKSMHEAIVPNRTNKNQYNHNDRCFEIGLRKFYGEPCISGYLVIQPEQVTHKLVEIESCLFDSESFSESNQESGCVDQIRQYRYDNVTLIPLVLSRRQ